jgi:uncharacterized protein (DUF58 family)
VQATHLTQGIAGLLTLLAFFSFVFDDASLFIVSSALAAFLLYRAVGVLREFASLVESIEVLRRTPNQFVRQGSVLSVDTEIVMKNESSLICSVSDLIPPSTVLISGSTCIPMDMPQSGNYRTSYRIKTLASGEHSFRGLRLRCADKFFAIDMVLSTPLAQHPILHVYPIKRFEYEGGGRFGEEDIERITPLPSSGIRSFREYVHGDSLKHIDWKMTAKYGKPYVREYMGRMGESVLIVVDLPDRESNYNTAAFATMMESVGSAVAGEAKKGSESFLMVVSGGNFIRYVPIQRDYSLVMEIMKLLGPEERLVHFYRVHGKQDIRTTLARLNGVHPPHYPGSLKSVLNQFVSQKQRTLFEMQITRMLRTSPTSELILFSLGEGDDSHLRIIAKEAKEARMRTHLRIPREVSPLSLTQGTRACRFDSVQVLG